MNYCLRFEYFCLLIVCCLSLDIRAETALIVADEWCPYSCSDEDQFQGLFVDIAQAAFKKEDIDIEYQVTSWTRAIHKVKTTNADILLGANQAQSDDFLLAKDFYIYDKTIFLVKNSAIFIEQPEQLSNYSIGLIDEYEYDETGQWEGLIENNPSKIAVTSSVGEKHLIELLLRERIDVAVINHDVANYHINNNNEYKDLKRIKPNISSKLYLGFNKSERGKALRTKFLAGFKKLQQNNTLSEIYKKYNIEMPNFGIENND